jgi:hypothetical protein
LYRHVCPELNRAENGTVNALGKGSQNSRSSQPVFGIVVGISSDNFSIVEPVEISTGVALVAHGLRQRFRNQVVAVQNPAFVMHNALLDNR